MALRRRRRRNSSVLTPLPRPDAGNVSTSALLGRATVQNIAILVQRYHFAKLGHNLETEILDSVELMPMSV